MRAPIAGTIAKLDVKPGETAAPGNPIGILADFSGWQIVTDDLTEIKVPNIEEGQPSSSRSMRCPSGLKGAVDSIGTLYQTNSGDIVYPVKVNLIEVDPRLRWGMTAALELESRRLDIMNKRILFIIGSLVLMSVIISACGSAQTATPTVEATTTAKTTQPVHGS